jgi:RNA polymerase primary sigma factor
MRVDRHRDHFSAGLADDLGEWPCDLVHERGVEGWPESAGRADEELRYDSEELAERTTDAMSLFLREVRRHPLLSREQEVHLAKRIERGDLWAKDQLVSCNLRLVIANARKFSGQELPLLDLIQEGILGLIRAAEKFDWRKGYKFSTYATFWIRQALQRALDSRARAIRIPVHLGQRERKLARAHRQLLTATGQEPSDEQLSRAAGLLPSEVSDMRAAARVVTSLDRPVGEEATVLGALLPSDLHGPEEELEIALRAHALRRAIDGLPERERQVVTLRYGIRGGEPLGQAQTGRRLGISQDAVRRLERKALIELARSRELEGLRSAA